METPYSIFLTCTTAHKASLGIVHHTPKDLKRRSKRPGANSKMFILMLTARLIKKMEQKILSSIMLSSKNRELRLVFEKRPWNVMPYSKYMKYTAIKWNLTKLTTRNLLCIGYQRFFPRVQHEAKSVISHRPTCLWQKAKDMHERKDLIKTRNCTWKASGTLSTRIPNSVSHQFGSTGMVSPVCISSLSLVQPFMAATGLHLAFGS